MVGYQPCEGHGRTVGFSRGVVQVSMNLTDFRQTSLRQAFYEACKPRGSQRYEVEILESEIGGAHCLVPRGMSSCGMRS